MASSRGEISVERPDGSPGGDPHMPRDARVFSKDLSLTRDQSSAQPREETSRSPTIDTSARRPTDRSAHHSRNHAWNCPTDWSKDRPTRDDSARNRPRAGYRNDMCDVRSNRLARRSKPPNRNISNCCASVDSSERSVDKGDMRKGGRRESEPETGSARGRLERRPDRKRYQGGKTRYCLGGERELRDTDEKGYRRARAESGSSGSIKGVGNPWEEDGGLEVGVSGLRKKAFGGGRRARKRGDRFEKGGEINGVRQRGDDFLSVRASAEASGILGGTSRGGKPSDGSKLEHASEGDDVGEQQLPRHLLGKKPEFKTSGGEVAKGEKMYRPRPRRM